MNNSFTRDTLSSQGPCDSDFWAHKGRPFRSPQRGRSQARLGGAPGKTEFNSNCAPAPDGHESKHDSRALRHSPDYKARTSDAADARWSRARYGAPPLSFVQ